MKMLNYTIQIDKKLKLLLRSIFRKNLNVELINKSDVNFSYKIISVIGKPLCHARVFRQKDYPSLKKLLWISEKLEESRIPQAKILFAERSSKNFPHGFMVSEWIDGINGWQAMEDGIYSLKNFSQKTAKLLYKIHSIKIPNSGWFNEKKSEYNNKYQKRISDIINDKKFQQLFNKNLLKRDYIENIIKTLLGAIRKIPLPQQAVLIHSDLNPDNIIVRNDKSLVFIDWDDAGRGWWLQDCAYLTYWSNDPQKAKTGFLAGYKKNNMSDKEIKIAELVEWILLSLKFLPYYKFHSIDKEKYEERLKRLQKDFNILKSRI